MNPIIELTIIEAETMQVLQEHKGEKNRISRDALRREVSSRSHLPVSDRLLRKVIERLRTDNTAGAYICSSTSGGGYYIAASFEELEAYLGSEDRRAKTILVRNSKQRQRAGMRMRNTNLPGME